MSPQGLSARFLNPSDGPSLVGHRRGKFDTDETDGETVEDGCEDKEQKHETRWSRLEQFLPIIEDKIKMRKKNEKEISWESSRRISSDLRLSDDKFVNFF